MSKFKDYIDTTILKYHKFNNIFHRLYSVVWQSSYFIGRMRAMAAIMLDSQTRMDTRWSWW